MIYILNNKDVSKIIVFGANDQYIYAVHYNHGQFSLITNDHAKY